MTSNAPYLIVSCGRSGSTSLAAILNRAENGTCASEPFPRLNHETREMREGRIADPVAVLKATVIPRITEQSRHVEVYGEKNLTYGPFITHLYDLIECKFVFVKRDGRDVVRSWINWHSKKFGDFYRECGELGSLSQKAVISSANLPVHLDDSADYSRPRPMKGEPLYDEWENLSRAEMCAYYWSQMNDVFLDNLEKLPPEAWITIDYTRPDAAEIERAATFCSLKGLGRDTVQKMLDQKINSLQDRGESEDGGYPHWRDWDGGMRRRFDRIAARTMHRLGYYGASGAEWRPAGVYGHPFGAHDADFGWHLSRHEELRAFHYNFVEWVRKMDDADAIASIADFGCGLAAGFSTDFAAKRYVGVDMSVKNIKWCKANRTNSGHEYINCDFVAEPLKERFDLVYSGGAIDNVYDVDAFLKAMVRASRKWIYFTQEGGWFPDHPEHRYRWNAGHRCFEVEASQKRIRETLAALGCTGIVIEPCRPRRAGVLFETRVFARAPKGGE